MAVMNWSRGKLLQVERYSVNYVITRGLAQVSNIVAVQYGTYSIVVCHCYLHQFFVHNVNLLGTQCVLKLLAEVKHRIQCYR
jgi:hypothetical protein